MYTEFQDNLMYRSIYWESFNLLLRESVATFKDVSFRCLKIWNFKNMTDYNFKDGRVYEGSRNPGSGTNIGNVRDGKIYEGSGSPGFGKNVGNVRDGKIYEGSGSPGFGKNIGNVRDGYVYEGSGSPGFGRKIGKVEDFTINGIQREKDETIVAVYHFLIKKIF